MIIFNFFDCLTLVKNFSSQKNVGLSKYTFGLFNNFAKLILEKNILQELN